MARKTGTSREVRGSLTTIQQGTLRRRELRFPLGTVHRPPADGGPTEVWMVIRLNGLKKLVVRAENNRMGRALAAGGAIEIRLGVPHPRAARDELVCEWEVQ